MLNVDFTSQNVYDSFNSFIFSEDTKVLSKLLYRAKIFQEIIEDEVPGDIVECGVFKGSGIFSWLKLRKIFAPNSFRKVIGFDFFDTKSLIDSLSGKDKENMSNLFTGRNFELDESYKEKLIEELHKTGFSDREFQLISGDISETSGKFALNNPGAKIAILYFDIDLSEPTYQALVNFWSMVSDGGWIVFDEYAHCDWSESKGADKFCKEMGLRVRSLDCPAPTAYIVK